jgi:opacity protein-like surface antigen
MKRMLVVALAAILVATVAGAALADDESPESEDTDTTAVLSDAQMWKARMIADYFVDEPSEEVDEEATAAAIDGLTDEIVGARTGQPSVGWGALYKVMQLWVATGDEDQTLTDFVTAMQDEGGWAFGKRFKALDEEQRTKLDDADLPKNLGQANKQAKAEERAERKANRNDDD